MAEAGMCRQKNAVNILAKNLFVFALAVTAYWFVGYSLMYGNAIAAGWLYFNGLFFDPAVTPELISEAGLVPSVDFLFQAAFAGTAATIVSGLVAERVKFGEFVVFALVLTAVIYPIAGAWQWNGVGAVKCVLLTLLVLQSFTLLALGQDWLGPCFLGHASGNSSMANPRPFQVTTWLSPPSEP